MRHGLLLGLFFVTILCASPRAQSNAVGSAPKPSNSAVESERLRQTARTLLESNSPDDTARAADLLLKASQIDAANAAAQRDIIERRTLEQPPVESWKTLASTLIPIVSTLIVAGTLAFNIYQGRVAERERARDRILQHESDERKRLDQAMETLQKTGSISPSAVLVNTFTTEPYRTEARSVGRSLLPRVKDFNEFEELFAAVYDPVTEADVPAVLSLLRVVAENLRPTITRVWANGQENLSVLSADETLLYRLYVSEQEFLSAKIAAVLRRPHAVVQPLDFSSLTLYGADLKGADLRGANLSYAGWSFVDVEGADLRGITNFVSFEPYLTAWWLAGKIEPALLEYLRQKFPYQEGQAANTRQMLSRSGYEDNLRRLRMKEASAPLEHKA